VKKVTLFKQNNITNKHPNYPQAHLNAAVLFELYRGKFIQAKTHYQAYLALKPNDKQTQKWLAGLEIKLASRKDS